MLHESLLAFSSPYLPELGTNLVTALASLNMNDLTHVDLLAWLLTGLTDSQVTVLEGFAKWFLKSKPRPKVFTAAPKKKKSPGSAVRMTEGASQLNSRLKLLREIFSCFLGIRIAGRRYSSSGDSTSKSQIEGRTNNMGNLRSGHRSAKRRIPVERYDFLVLISPC